MTTEKLPGEIGSKPELGARDVFEGRYPGALVPGTLLHRLLTMQGLEKIQKGNEIVWSASNKRDGNGYGSDSMTSFSLRDEADELTLFLSLQSPFTARTARIEVKWKKQRLQSDIGAFYLPNAVVTLDNGFTINLPDPKLAVPEVPGRYDVQALGNYRLPPGVVCTTEEVARV